MTVLSLLSDSSSLKFTYQPLGPDDGGVQLWVDVLQVPPKTLAAELLPECLLLREVTDVNGALVQEVEVAMAVEEVPILVEPDLGYPSQVTLHRLLPVLGELVRVLATEDVADPRTRDDLDLATTHPDLPEGSGGPDIKEDKLTHISKRTS